MLNETRGPVTQRKAQSDQYYTKVIPPISYPAASKILITDITDFKFHTPQTMC
jgi:hypothetical protein